MYKPTLSKWLKILKWWVEMRVCVTDDVCEKWEDALERGLQVPEEDVSMNLPPRLHHIHKSLDIWDTPGDNPPPHFQHFQVKGSITYQSFVKVICSQITNLWCDSQHRDNWLRFLLASRCIFQFLWCLYDYSSWFICFFSRRNLY